MLHWTFNLLVPFIGISYDQLPFLQAHGNTSCAFPERVSWMFPGHDSHDSHDSHDFRAQHGTAWRSMAQHGAFDPPKVSRIAPTQRRPVAGWWRWSLALEVTFEQPIWKCQLIKQIMKETNTMHSWLFIHVQLVQLYAIIINDKYVYYNIYK